MSFSQRFQIWLAKNILNKVQKSYAKRHQKPLPTILVTGTAGKSSQTLLITELFSKDGWQIFTGASPEKCLNSVTGLSMVLAGFRLNFEGAKGKQNKLKFIWKCLWFICFENYNHLPEKTILIYELGYDHQNESLGFAKIFEKGFDLLITTNITQEHTGGFASKLNRDMYAYVAKHLPNKWQEVLHDLGLDVQLKNIALEQFSLISLADSYIIPASFGMIDNWVMDNLEASVRTHLVHSQRDENFTLVADHKYTFSQEYLLPPTFAKTAYILELIARKFSIPEHYITETIQSLQLPNGRFTLFSGMMNTTIVDSSYNSDPQSLLGFLDLLEEVLEVGKSSLENRLPDGTQHSALPPKHYLILGEMRELGDSAGLQHKLILDRLIEIGMKWRDYIENIYLLGSEWLDCNDDGIVKTHGEVSYISYNKQFFKVFRRAGDINKLLTIETIRPNSWFWIKGSQNTIFLETTVKHLLAHNEDSQKLCRQGEEWDELRRPFM
jgi:UDP-N-acetylmuramyl pentapeptide synthase